jgi:hypothetical protein
VRLLVERVVVTGDHIAIEHAVPISGRFCGVASTGSTCCAARAARQTPGTTLFYRRRHRRDTTAVTSS